MISQLENSPEALAKVTGLLYVPIPNTLSRSHVTCRAVPVMNTSSHIVATTAIIRSCWSRRIVIRVAVEGDSDTAAGGAGRVHGGAS